MALANIYNIPTHTLVLIVLLNDIEPSCYESRNCYGNTWLIAYMQLITHATCNYKYFMCLIFVGKNTHEKLSLVTVGGPP